MIHKYEELTLEIAKKKIDLNSKSNKIKCPRFGTGGNFADVFFWDTVFTCLWAKYFKDILPVEQSLDNLYRLALSDGYIARQYLPIGEPCFNPSHPISYSPPILSWGELDLYKLYKDESRLREVFPKLQRFHQAFREHFMLEDGLFFSDLLGCGMDNLPRWPRDWNWDDDDVGQKVKKEDFHPTMEWLIEKLPNWGWKPWTKQGRYIDASAQAAYDSLCMKRIADILGDSDASSKYAEEHSVLKELINSKCWSERLGFYCDLAGDVQVERLHIGGFWPMIAEICSQDRLERVVSHLTNPETFGRTVPVPTLAANDPDYRSDGEYWLGSSWAPTTYMVLCGLKNCGYQELATKIARKFVDAVETVFEETGTLWENYAPDAISRGNRSQPDFVGWTGLATTAIPREFL